MKSQRNFGERFITDDIGESIFAFAAKVYPICRSITGDGVRETLREIGKQIKLDVHEVPTGTAVFDWTIPREWNIRDAYIKNERGEKIVDFARSNLHVVSYSVPIRQFCSLAELKKHLHTIPEQPDLIPYRTSYYTENWGFCITHRQLESLQDETYEVFIDSSLEDGFLTYGECLHKGETDEEFLLSAHICHPSLADDNCSGVALLTCLAKRIDDLNLRTRYSYRFLFAPGTIGAIAWLARNEARARLIKHGLIISMVGDGGGPTYKKSRRGDAKVDRAVGHVLRHSGLDYSVIDFFPYGYDERQYCSPGFNLPVGLFQRSKFGSIPQYHTSADNLTFIGADHLARSFCLLAASLDVIENDFICNNVLPRCEPQLGRRGLYRSIGQDRDAEAANLALLWVLNLADGDHSLLNIAERANLPFAVVYNSARLLQQHGLVTGLPATQTE